MKSTYIATQHIHPKLLTSKGLLQAHHNYILARYSTSIHPNQMELYFDTKRLLQIGKS